MRHGHAGRSGTQLLQELGTTHPRTRALAVTGHAASEDLAWLAAHDVPVLLKPFSVSELTTRALAVLS